jgi:exodeoxyribonuclease VII large subunit
LARGGGSLEDLWCFNDERVVRAVASSQIPVITGIGHETDFTLADFAADLRAPTPTAAAVAATPHQDELRQSLADLRARIDTAWSIYRQMHVGRLAELRARLERMSPAWRIRNDRQRVDELSQRCQTALEHSCQVRRLLLAGIENRLAALNPLAVLQRGFAIVRRPDGSLVHSARTLSPGQAVDVRLAEGGFTSRVEEVKIT